jgi:general secretion pathway protein G
MRIGEKGGARGLQTKPGHGGSAGFTLLEMVIVLAIIGILAAIVAPSLFVALSRSREATLQQDLKIMRKLIDDYYGDKGTYPPSLQTLVEQGYMRTIPPDPVNGNRTEWKTVIAKEGGISDVHSLSNERGANDVPYGDW